MDLGVGSEDQELAKKVLCNNIFLSPTNQLLLEFSISCVDLDSDLSCAHAHMWVFYLFHFFFSVIHIGKPVFNFYITFHKQSILVNT